MFQNIRPDQKQTKQASVRPHVGVGAYDTDSDWFLSSAAPLGLLRLAIISMLLR